jgi:hypothetical protein
VCIIQEKVKMFAIQYDAISGFASTAGDALRAANSAADRYAQEK